MGKPLTGLSPISVMDTQLTVLDDFLYSEYKGILPTDILKLKSVNVKLDSLAISAFNKIKKKIVNDTIDVIQDPNLPDPGTVEPNKK